MRIGRTFLFGGAFLVSAITALLACVADEPAAQSGDDTAGDSGTDGTTSGDGSNEAATCGSTTSDSANCGACGHACATGYSCTNSVCGNAAVAIAAGGSHTCVALAKGDVWCWGNNNDGEIGVGTTSDGGLAPTLVARNSTGQTVTATAFASGAAHTCTLSSDKTVQCWGSDVTAQIGDTHVSDDGGPLVVSVPTTVQAHVFGQPAPTFSGLAHGPAAEHTCALDPTGVVMCWGLDSSDQVTAGIDAGGFFAPCQGSETCELDAFNPIDGNASQVTVGSTFSCALFVDGGAGCWGTNIQGELGGGDTDRFTHFETPILPAAASFIASGSGSSCAILKSDGSVWCWGLNEQGELGHDQSDGGDGCCSVATLCNPVFSECNSTPSRVPDLSGATSVAMGDAHACALKSDNTVWCWGSNANGQLGTGDNAQSFVPRQVPGVSDAIAIAAGGNHACAIHKDGTVSCWGANDQLQLGSGVADSNTPVKIAGLPH